MENSADLKGFGRLYHAFQPIYGLAARNVLGYEALIRTGTGASPNDLFQTAQTMKCLSQMDMWSIEAALRDFFSMPALRNGRELLFVNVFPSTLVGDAFPSFIEGLGRNYRHDRQRVVLEINESITEERVWNDPLFARRIQDVREQGFRIALDDVGEGVTSLRKIVELSPDFIKLDRFFSRELSRSGRKQKMVRLFAEYCRNDAGLILEGIEREEDLRQAAVLSVPFGQGYVLGKPAPLASGSNEG